MERTKTSPGFFERNPAEHDTSDQSRKRLASDCEQTGIGKIQTDQYLRLFWAISAIFFYGLICKNSIDLDVWHQMALIRESLAQGHLLRTDVFAYTPTVNPISHHEWGAGVLDFAITKELGLSGLIGLKFLAASAAVFFCLRCCRVLKADIIAITLLLPIAALDAFIGFGSPVRAQVYTFVFAAMLLWFLERDRSLNSNRGWIYGWLLVFVFWVNLHGGFVVAFALILAHILERAINRERFGYLIFVLLAMCGCVLLNPDGGGYIRHLSHSLMMSRPWIPEWGKISSNGPLLATFLASLGMVLCAFFGPKNRRILAGEFVLMITAGEAFLHLKMLPLFGIAFLCYVPSWFGSGLRRLLEREKLLISAYFACILVVGIVLSLRAPFWRIEVPPHLYPVAAVHYLQETGFHGNLMVPFSVGAYVSWNLYPAVKISLDSRYDVAYPTWWVDRVFRTYDGSSDWERVFSTSGTDMALVPTDAPLLKLISASKWKPAYADNSFVLFARPR